MGATLNLALALEGRAKPAPANEQLVAIADALAGLPDPQIDTSFMQALEQRLLTEELSAEQQADGRHLHAVPSAIPQTPADEIVRRAPIVQMPKRRFVVRRSVAAAAVAASLAAFPVAAAASSLPGSPLYGLKTKIEQLQLRVFGTPMQDASRHIGFAVERLNEVEQLIARSADDALIAQTLARAEQHFRAAAELVAAHGTDQTDLQSLSAQTSEAQQRLREVAPVLAPQAGDEFRDALAASTDLRNALDVAMGFDASAILGDPADEAIVLEDGGAGVSGITFSSSTSDGDGSTEDTRSAGSKDPNGGDGQKDDQWTPDATKQIEDTADEGCQIPGSADGLGDLLAPVARITCT